MSPLLQIVLAGIGTYLIRLSAIALAGRFPPPGPSTEATLRFIAPATLAALVVNSLLLDDGSFTVRVEWWLAAVVVAAVTWRWKSAGLAIAAGMFAVWLLTTIGG